MISRGRLCLISCHSGIPFSTRIIKELNDIYGKQPDLEPFHITKSEEIVFSNGEIKTVILDNIRGQDVYVIQCVDDPTDTNRSVNDNLLATYTAINAAYNSDPESITAVIPQFPYARQERKKERESITAQQVARFLETSGATRVITIDIHSEAIEGFFYKTHLENLHASNIISEYFLENYVHENLIVVAPDMGSADRARTYAQTMKAELAIVDKERHYDRPSAIKGMNLVGDVRNKDVFIGDDLVDTGGTLLNAMLLLKEKGAKTIYLGCSLPFFSGNAVENFSKAHEKGLFDGFIGTDAVFHGEDFIREHKWYKEVSVAPLFAQVIHNINQKQSVSKLLC